MTTTTTTTATRKGSISSIEGTATTNPTKTAHTNDTITHDLTPVVAVAVAVVHVVFVDVAHLRLRLRVGRAFGCSVSSTPKTPT